MLSGQKVISGSKLTCRHKTITLSKESESPATGVDDFSTANEHPPTDHNVPIPSTEPPPNKTIIPKINANDVYSCGNFSVFHSNVQSINGRLGSLKAIVNTLNVDLVTLNETNLRGNNKFTLEGFKTFFRNRKEGNMGGIATAVKEKYSMNTLKVSEGTTEEYLVTRHGQYDPAINVINLYGAKESCQTIEEIREGWEAVLQEVIKIEAKKESAIIIGDLNRHISDDLIKENHKKSSVAGKLLLEFVANGNYVVVNSLECVEGGPFTRFDPSDPTNNTKKSVLDLAIISKNLVQYVNKFKIDQNLEWTPSRSRKGSLKHPDHYAILLELKGIPMKPPIVFPGRKITKWNTRKKEGWEKYKLKT